MLHDNKTAKAYDHIVSKYRANMPMTEKENVIKSALSFLMASPKSELIHNYGGAGHSTVADEISRIEIHAKNHGISI